MRKPMIAGNWKMNLLSGEGVALVAGLWERISEQKTVEVVVCPPYTDIPAVSEEISEGGMDIVLGAQNMHWEDSGAFTGELSPGMLIEHGVSHVIIGHSERRQLFGETDQGVNRKVKSAFDHDLTPIVCIGETLKQREAGETENVVVGQVKRGLFEVKAGPVRTAVIAYEPIWAIGTGKAATAEDAEEVIALIRGTIAEMFDAETAEEIRILYGGSVKPGNISELMSMPNIDGALVGGASLDAEDFARIVQFT